ncbi:MAG: DUF1460 domain-containing protein, partial [Candidatus Sericytochromatia bacterium]|nr:DUF1460 domain-containing protein [Candidatus Sericytochromatia bacterium]
MAVCTRTFRVAADRGWGRLPIDQVVVAVARSFVGLPYKAKGLERPGDESLIVDFSGLDCTTFVESSLALARCIRLHQPTFAAFERELTAIRYRDGRIDQYPSRLHYFSDWIHEGDRQGRVDDVTAAIGGTPHPLRLTFMTLHPQAYQALRNPAYVTAMQAIEKTISARPYHFLPKQAIPKTGDRIHPGDVIAITTNVPGLDISHVGFAVTGDDGNLHLLHAPALGRKIEITREPLAAA